VEAWPLPRTERRTPSRLSTAGFCFGNPCRKAGGRALMRRLPQIIPDSRNGNGAVSFTWNRVPQERVVVGGPYLRRQAEILIAISRTTFDLVVASRLREVASDLQAKAAEQDAECRSAASEMANFKLPRRS
jgi:hypothetical protein